MGNLHIPLMLNCKKQLNYMKYTCFRQNKVLILGNRRILKQKGHISVDLGRIHIEKE